MPDGRESVEHLRDFPVIELRRYTVKRGERDNFVECFQSFFPEAFQQLSVMIFGTFLERRAPERFAWIRGFHDNFHRGSANSAFYYGPVWREHRNRMNDRLDDSDNVLQLTPVDATRPLPILPSVDPVSESNHDAGVVVAVIFSVRPDEVKKFLDRSGPLFADYRKAGITEVTVLQTLDAANTFPQLPVRSDGPFVVWLGIAPSSDDFEPRLLATLENAKVEDSLMATLRSRPELVVLDPSRRSRLRWRPEYFGSKP